MMSVVPLIFAHNNDQDVIKQRLNDNTRVDSSLKYRISQVMDEILAGQLLQSPSQNEYLPFCFLPIAIRYPLSESILFNI